MNIQSKEFWHLDLTAAKAMEVDYNYHIQSRWRLTGVMNLVMHVSEMFHQ